MIFEYKVEIQILPKLKSQIPTSQNMIPRVHACPKSQLGIIIQVSKENDPRCSQSH